MKIKFLKLVCLLVWITAGANLSLAQDEITVLKYRYPHPQQFQSSFNFDFDKSQYKKVQDQNGIERYIKKEVLERSKLGATNREGVENATVTLAFNMPSGDLEISSIRMYSQNYFFWLDPWEISDGILVTEIPGETYQLIVQFSMYSDEPIFKGCAEGLIVKEDVVINQDTTITINYADAKNVIYLEKKLPNGAPFADGDFDERVGDYINQPNVRSLMSNMHFIDKDYGELSRYALIFREGNYIDEDGVSHDQRFRLMVSDLSDRYCIIQAFTAYGLDDEQNNFYTVTSEISGVSESENIPCNGNYNTVPSSFKPSIFGENSIAFQRANAFLMYLDEEAGSMSIQTANVVPTGGLRMPLKMHVCEGENIDGTSNHRNYYCSVSLMEYYDMNNFMDVNILVPWGDVSSGETKYQVISPLVSDFNYNRTPDGKGYYKSNSTFSFKESEVTDFFGNSTPITIFGNNYTQFGSKYHQPICNYVGRMGENRQTDNYNLNYSLLYNGEEICNNYQYIQNGWMWQWYSEGHEDGAYDATIVNQNMTVDDMQGCNTTKVHYDTRNEDFTPPTAMMLQFRNSEDNSVTDRFETGDDGVMYLAAKDYHLGLNEERSMCMETLPVNVKASYSPYGKEEWTELDIAEMSELFDEYAFGYIYAATLGQVTGSSENKWYDLKIELSDEAGNWQEQIISPAFRIEGRNTGISEAQTGNDARIVARYTIDGCQIATPQNGVNIIKYSDGSVCKIIVK